MKLQKRINYFLPGGSFSNNPLLNAVEANRQKYDSIGKDLTNKAVTSVRESKQRADQRNKHLHTAEANARKKHSMLNNVARIQDNLWKQGYFGDIAYEKAVDGRWGKMTQDAYNKSKLGKKSNNTVDNNRGKTTQNTDNAVKSINKREASELYKNGTGSTDVYSTGAFHLLAPERLDMPHSSGLKDQVAAEIAYTEGLPISQREKDPHNVKGVTYIGYGTHGRLSGQNENVNKQSNKNNATAKVFGGYRYRINSDGSVDVEDPYSFNIVRDFTRKNSQGDPYVYQSGEDPYAEHEWQGLWHDLTTSGEGKSIQNLAENFMTRQGKKRNNNIHFAPGEINDRNSRR